MTVEFKEFYGLGMRDDAGVELKSWSNLVIFEMSARNSSILSRK